MEKRRDLKTIFQLFVTFAKIGGFTFGGGLAMLPLIQHETVERRKWVTEQDIMDILAIAESTPGPIAINSATFIGYQTAGFWGAFAATFGVILPSFVVISIIATVLTAFQQNLYVQYAFNGIRAGMLALIVKSLWTMYKKCPKHAWSYVVMVAAFALSAFTGINVVWIILGCAAFGLAATLIAQRRAEK
ncbi:MAG: chromate transporter [Clostridia bacterium]|nr:chromate transporter [Clostridia bacterium]